MYCVITTMSCHSCGGTYSQPPKEHFLFKHVICKLHYYVTSIVTLWMRCFWLVRKKHLEKNTNIKDNQTINVKVIMHGKSRIRKCSFLILVSSNLSVLCHVFAKIIYNRNTNMKLSYLISESQLRDMPKCICWRHKTAGAVPPVFVFYTRKNIQFNGKECTIYKYDHDFV